MLVTAGGGAVFRRYMTVRLATPDERTVARLACKFHLACKQGQKPLAIVVTVGQGVLDAGGRRSFLSQAVGWSSTIWRELSGERVSATIFSKAVRKVGSS